jgi:glucose/arabinose dehydrogenase
VFYPARNPQWLYVANTDSVVRYRYTKGDLKVKSPAEIVIKELPSSRPRDQEAFSAYDRAVEAGKQPPDHGHWTRDLALSLDGKRLFVAVGSASNLDDPDDHPSETRRADILEYTPEGQFVKIYASGIRNPSGLAVDPATGQLWCSVNERDGLGDNLVPDYITHVEEGGFYGWPWYYMGEIRILASQASILN